MGYEGTGQGHFKSPTGVAVDSNGRILVVDTVARYNVKSITLYCELATLGKSFVALTQLRAEREEIVRVFMLKTTDLSQDTDQVIRVCGFRVQIFDKEGNFVSQFGQKGEHDGEFQGPWNVATDKKDRIFVVEGINHRVQIFDAEANHICTFGSRGKSKGTFDTPYGLAVDPKGRIWVSDQSNHRLQVF